MPPKVGSVVRLKPDRTIGGLAHIIRIEDDLYLVRAEKRRWRGVRRVVRDDFKVVSEPEVRDA